MELGSVKVLKAKRSRDDSALGSDSPSPNTSDQMIHEVLELEDLIRLSCDIRSLGDGRRIRRYDGVGHAANCSNGTSRVSDLSYLL